MSRAPGAAGKDWFLLRHRQEGSGGVAQIHGDRRNATYETALVTAWR